MKTPHRLLTLLTVPLLLGVACDKVESDYPSYVSFVTVHVPEESPSDYYFRFDNQQTAWPGNKSRVMYNSNEKDGHRAIIYFDYLAQAVPGYDCNIDLYSVMDILSKEVEVAETTDDILELGDDRIGVSEACIRGGWLDLYYYYPTDGHATTRHRLSLVDNRTANPPADMPSEYLYLEFRQNADGDTSGFSMVRNYVSYRLGDYDPTTTGHKGICLRVAEPGPEGKVTYLYIEPKE